MRNIFISLSISFVAFACPDEADKNAPAIELAFNGLETLGADYTYEG